MVVWLGSWWLTAAATAMGALALREFYGLLVASGARLYPYVGLPWAVAVVAVAGTGDSGMLWTVFYGGLALALVVVVAHDRSIRTVSVWALTTFGVVYIGLTFALGLLLRQEDQGLQWLLLALLATFATDTSAYAVGRLIGRHQMVPTISPGKTWEGAVGGLVGCIAATVGLVALLDLPLAATGLVALGVGIGAIAQMGDLMESKFKRLAGAKDSGRLIPGHGGLLDRVDSLVLVFPLVYYVARGASGA